MSFAYLLHFQDVKSLVQARTDVDGLRDQLTTLLNTSQAEKASLYDAIVALREGQSSI